jgi:uncharacterized membrane protein YebE (DUF533 family)
MSTGGRFPSDLNIPRTFGATRSRSSDDSSDDRDTLNAGAVAVAAPVLTSRHAEYSRGDENPYSLKGIASDSPSAAGPVSPASYASYDEDQTRYMSNPAPHQAQQTAPVDRSMFLPGQQDLAQQPAPTYQQPASAYQQPAPTYQQPAAIDPPENQHADWIAPAAVGAGAGVAGTAAYNHYNHDREPEMQQQQQEQQPIVKPTTTASNTAPNTALGSGVETAPAVATAAAPVSYADRTPFTSIDRALESTPTATASGLPGSVDNPPLATAHTVNGGTYLSYPAETGTGLAGSSATPVTGLNSSSNSPVTSLDQGMNGSNALGGHEAKGAHETGRFPVVRHDTDISVSQLHVPGEFPDRASGI